MTDAIARSRPVGAVVRIMRFLAVLAVFAMCVVMCWDVAFRYFLFRPLAWSQEVIQLLMVTVFCAGLPLATVQAEHIIVDVISAHFRGAVARVARTLVVLTSSALMAAMAYFSSRFALRLMAFGDRTDWLGIPWHLAAWAAAAAFAVAAISCFLSVNAKTDGGVL